MDIPASAGYENEAAILLQAHIDMVCAKDEGVDFDFEKDAIVLKITDNKLHADGTTLGADNGVGAATMLAIADSSEILHPRLELLFTVEEEIGLIGIREFDMSKITARRMINMDCGDSHVLAVSSLGRCLAKIERNFNEVPLNSDFCALQISLFGGIGGHSGLMARKGRNCAGNTMGELLSCVSDYSAHLCSIECDKPAILKKCTAVIAVKEEQADEAVETLLKRFNAIKSIYEKTDPDMSISVSKKSAPTKALSPLETQEIANVLSLIRTGPYREDGADNSILITLSVLNDAVLKDGKFSGAFSVRSSNDADMEMLYGLYKRLAELQGFNVEITDYYSGWKEAALSPFRDKAVSVHNKIFGYEPLYERVQGGIETSTITGKLADMDAIGFAPTARGAHTTEEYIALSQTPDFWRWMLAILEEKE